MDYPLQAQRSTEKDGTPSSPELRSSSTHYGVERCVVVATRVALSLTRGYPRFVPSEQFRNVLLKNNTHLFFTPPLGDSASSAE